MNQARFADVDRYELDITQALLPLSGYTLDKIMAKSLMDTPQMMFFSYIGTNLGQNIV